MKVQHITPQIINKKQNSSDKTENVRFTGAGDWATLALRFLDTNQAIGANSVDLCSMVIPRTAYDMKKRGPEAGLETARRESAGTLNHTFVGAYGVLGGMLVASMINSKYGIRADKIFADNKTTDILAKNWHNALKSKDADPLRTYLNNVVDNVKVFNTSKNAETGWTGIPDADKKLVVDKFYDLLKNGKNDRIDKESAAYIKSIITAATGGEKVRLEFHRDKKLVEASSNTLNTLIENIHNMSKVFTKDKVQKIFIEAKDVDSNSFVNALKSMNNKRTAIGLGIATAIGMSIQPLNKYLTFKKTGQSGFVGVPGRKEDHSTKFKVMKGITGLAFGLGALSTITRKPREFVGKIQFKGMLPTIDQLKFVYGMTIMSRLWAARDTDELRESAVKDTLGFLNLLVLGALVTKYTAKALDKSKSLFNKLEKNGKSTLGAMKTRDEVLLSTLKDRGISTVKDGKALKFRELMELIKDLPDTAQKELKSKLNVLNISQFVGYLYSGLVLGLGVPALNKHMTEKSDAKYKAKFAAQQSAQQDGTVQNKENQSEKTSFGQNVNNINPVLTAQNKAFMDKHM